MITASSRDFLHVVFKRKTLIFLFLLLSVLITTFVSIIMEPVYQANAKIMVKIGRENVYNPEGGAENPLFTPNKEEQINSEIEILKSQILFKKVADSIGVTNIYSYIGKPSFLGSFFPTPENTDEESTNTNAILKLQEDSHVEKVPRSDVIKVSFDHSDPKIAAQVINTWIDFFLDSHLDVHQNTQSLEYYRKQSEIMKSKLEKAKEMQSDFMELNNISIEPEEERKLLMRQLSGLRVELNKTLNKEAAVTSRIQSIHYQLNKTNKDIQLNEKINRRANKMNTLLTQLAELKRQKASLLVDNNQQSLQAQQVQEKIVVVKAQLKEQKSLSRLVPHAGMEDSQQSLQQSLSQNEIEINALRALKQVQTSALADIQQKVEQVSRIETEYGDYTLKVKLNLKNYHSYLSKLEGSRMSSEMNKERISNVRLINPAQPPLVPISPNIQLNILLSILVGVVGGFSLAFLLEYMDDALDSEEDVEHHLDLPVLALIPINKEANIMPVKMDQYSKVDTWPMIGEREGQERIN